MCGCWWWVGNAKWSSHTWGTWVFKWARCNKLQMMIYRCFGRNRGDQYGKNKKRRCHHIYSIQVLITSTMLMSIPLLSESAMILERLSRIFKECKRHGSKQRPALVPEVNGIHDTPNPAYSYRGKSLLPSLQWKYCWAAGRRHTHHQPVLALPHVMDVIVILQKNTAA